MAPILIGGSLSFFSFLFHLLLLSYFFSFLFLPVFSLLNIFFLRIKFGLNYKNHLFNRICTELTPSLYRIIFVESLAATMFESPSYPFLLPRAYVYIMCTLPCPSTFLLKNMFYNILINQAVTKLFQKTCEKTVDIFGLNCNMRYFCTRFPRDGKPCN